MAKKKRDLSELEVTLRDAFQKYRRRLDMLTRAKSLPMSGEELNQFIDAMHAEDEELAKRLMKIASVRDGG